MKKVKFIYKVPSVIRQYIDNVTVLGVYPASSDANDVGKFKEKVTMQKNFRAPIKFNGDCCLIFQGLDSSIVLNNIYPVKFLFNVTCPVSITFKGLSDLSVRMY